MKSNLAFLFLLPLVAIAAGPQGSGNAPARANGAANGSSGPNARMNAATECPAVCASACIAAYPSRGNCTAVGGRRDSDMMARGDHGACVTVAAGTATTLSAGALVAAVEEERLAHDVYALAASKWQLRVFARIADAETRHAVALTTLAGGVALTLPAATPGTYTTTDLQALYDSLHALVAESDLGALRAGALVEETDIADLRTLLRGDLDAGTRSVLTQLEAASQHHLLAFVRTLASRGVTYTPQVLTAADYHAIISPDV